MQAQRLPRVRGASLAGLMRGQLPPKLRVLLGGEEREADVCALLERWVHESDIDAIQLDTDDQGRPFLASQLGEGSFGTVARPMTAADSMACVVQSLAP